MALDSKYGRVRFDDPTVTIGDDEPVVVFRAQDRLLPKLLKVYRYFCDLAGSPEHHLAAIDRAAETVKAWQADPSHPTKTPTSDALDPNPPRE